MVTVEEIFNFLEKLAPSFLADTWDNVGLLVGNPKKKVKTILFALSISKKVILEAKEKNVDLIITHHPVTLKGEKRFLPDSYVYMLINNKIAHIALHTNLDISDISPSMEIAQSLALKKVEPLATDEPKYGLIGLFEGNFDTLLNTLKKSKALAKDVYRIVKPIDFAKLLKRKKLTVAICSGSGESLIKDAIFKGAQIYISGDIKYHAALEAKDKGLCILDLGHYGTEFYFFKPILEDLKNEYPNIDYLISQVDTSPFETLNLRS